MVSCCAQIHTASFHGDGMRAQDILYVTEEHYFLNQNCTPSLGSKAGNETFMAMY